ncbi:MAG: three-Cys-motif partner protein TcmP [Polyangiaceae bacterium]|nr:three-Cys-motif partner protein TcmP [Polyangiaceae bacterium]
MAAPKTTTWCLEPHTRAKHEILRRYLEAWTPILSLGGSKHLIYVDGFAGPGRYDGGEEGSPLIALKAALAHRDRIEATVSFLFIERDVERARMLEAVVAEVERPSNFPIKVAAGKQFEEAFGELLGRGQQLPPTFAFIDPFGWTGIPFSLVKRILSFPRCEVLVNFMYEEINRFLGHADQHDNLDKLFGCQDWRKLTAIQGPAQRRAAIHGLYQRQLGTAAKYVRSFEMRNDKDVTDYFLFFATNSPKGIAKMKEAMWKVDESGEFRFSDATNPTQGLLFSQKPDFDALRRLIVTRFAGKETTVAGVEDFVLAETPYRETHYKKQVLAMLEREGKVSPVNPPAGRKAGTYAEPTMRLRFVP